MYDGRTLHAREAIEILEENFGELVFKTRIRKTVRYAEAPVKGNSVLKYDPPARPRRRTASCAKEVSMARKRASMREGPLAELFRATEAAQRGQADAGAESREQPAAAPEAAAESSREAPTSPKQAAAPATRRAARGDGRARPRLRPRRSRRGGPGCPTAAPETPRRARPEAPAAEAPATASDAGAGCPRERPYEPPASRFVEPMPEGAAAQRAPSATRRPTSP